MGRTTASRLIKGATNNTSIRNFLSQTQSTPVTPNKKQRPATSPATLENLEEDNASISDIARGINAINQKLNSMQIDISNNNDLLSTVTKKVSGHHLSIASLNTQTSQLQQANLNDRIEICYANNAPFDLKLNAKEEMLKLFNKLAIEIDPIEIADAYFKRKQTRTAGVRNVVVVIFIHQAIKNRVMRAKIGSNSNEAKLLYFNEILTPNVSAILYRAKQLRKEGKFSNTGTLDGQVFVRATRGGDKIFVRSIFELDELLKVNFSNTKRD